MLGTRSGARTRSSTRRTTTASTRGVATTKDEKYILIDAQSTVSSECALRATPTTRQLAFKVFLPRERDHEYQVEHLDGRWIIRTNWQAPNFRLVRGQASARRATARTGRRSSRTATTPSSMASTCSSDFLAIEERSGGCARSASGPGAAARTSYIASDEPAYAMASDANAEIDTHIAALRLHLADDAGDDLRLRHPDRRAPAAQARAGARRLRPRELRAPSSCGRRRATARRCPVSLVYRKGFTQGRHGAAAAVRLRLLRLVDGPGVLVPRACRCSTAASSTPSRTSAAARRWAAPGTTTASCSTRRTPSPTSSTSRASWSSKATRDPKRVFAMGGSAGGLLMGAVANMAPADYRAHRRAGAVRRRRHDDARRDHPAHDQRVRRVGQPEGEGVLRLHAVVLAVRQRRARRPIRRCS